MSRFAKMHGECEDLRELGAGEGYGGKERRVGGTIGLGNGKYRMVIGRRTGKNCEASFVV